MAQKLLCKLCLWKIVELCKCKYRLNLYNKANLFIYFEYYMHVMIFVVLRDVLRIERKGARHLTRKRWKEFFEDLVFIYINWLSVNLLYRNSDVINKLNNINKFYILWFLIRICEFVFYKVKNFIFENKILNKFVVRNYKLIFRYVLYNIQRLGEFLNIITLSILYIIVFFFVMFFRFTVLFFRFNFIYLLFYIFVVSLILLELLFYNFIFIYCNSIIKGNKY
jgi:hypothetical protein